MNVRTPGVWVQCFGLQNVSLATYKCLPSSGFTALPRATSSPLPFTVVPFLKMSAIVSLTISDASVYMAWRPPLRQWLVADRSHNGA